MATVEARMASSRLPGKNARPILGRPMLARLLERLKRATEVDVVCLATTEQALDDELAGIAREQGAAVFRGAVDDVLSRVLGAAASVSADAIVEITGDCPLIDPAIVDAVMRRYVKGGFDYVANVLDVLTFPIGFDVQVYSVDLLADVERLAQDPEDRLNVTSFIYRHPDRYRLLNVTAPSSLNRPAYRLCVDYSEDLEVVRAIFAALYSADPAFSAATIIGFLDQRPDLVAKNTWMDDAFSFPSSGGAATQELLEMAL
ncbi:MAG: glycosyltransferase family protein [Candidatus Rokubacteria bacterium]|nr:glycosyltransferase family protein [Candidatus Rokubacteria bacterium]